MPNISFDTGVVSFVINDSVEVKFNPTDATFVSRLYEVFDRLEEKQEAYKDRIEQHANNKEIFQIAREMDREMRAEIDELFAADVCEPVFGSVNVYALADGLPLWANLFMAVMDMVDTAFAREQKATNPRVAKYTAKWNKKKK